MNKKQWMTLLIIALLIGTYCTVLFLVTKNYEVSFWTSFGFIMAAFVMLTVSFVFVANEKRSSQVVGMPITVLTSIYFVLEFIMGTVFMCFPNLSFVAVFIPQLILTVLYLVCFIPAILSDKNYK